MNIQENIAVEEKTVGGTIRAKRLSLKWRIVDLSNKIGLTPGYVSKIEQNIAKYPSDTILYRIAIELGLDPVQLLRLKEHHKEQSRVAKNVHREHQAEPPEKASRSIGPNAGLALFQQDTVNAVSQVKSPSAFQEEYLQLAEAYNAFGLRCCTTPAADGSLEYQAGLAAYQAAATYYVQAGRRDLVCNLHYRMARTYQNLVITDQVHTEERLFFLYRASALADRAFTESASYNYEGANHASKGEENKTPESGKTRWAQQRLQAASLAIGATLNKLIAVELRGQKQQASLSDDQREAFQMELDTLGSAANIRRVQADTIYSAIIDGLRADCLVLSDPARNWKALVQMYSELADAFRLKAINWRGKETGQQALLLPRRATNDMGPERHNLARSLTFLNEAVETQRFGVKMLETWGTEDKKFSSIQANMRSLLAKFHQEWGATFSQSNREDWFAQALWQFGVSQEVSAAGWGRDEYTAGDQFVTDFIKNLQTDAPKAQREDVELHQRVLAASIRASLDRLKMSGAFITLTYPLLYTEEPQDAENF